MTDYSSCFDTTDAQTERPYRIQSRLVSSLSASVIPPRRPAFAPVAPTSSCFLSSYASKMRSFFSFCKLGRLLFGRTARRGGGFHRRSAPTQATSARQFHSSNAVTPICRNARSVHPLCPSKTSVVSQRYLSLYQFKLPSYTFHRSTTDVQTVKSLQRAIHRGGTGRCSLSY